MTAGRMESATKLGPWMRRRHGNYLTDIASVLGSLDFVMGECDR